MEVFWKGQTAAQMLYSTHFMHQPTQLNPGSVGAGGNTSLNNVHQPVSNMNANHQYVHGSVGTQGPPGQNLIAANHLEQVVAAATVVTAPTQSLACALCPKTFDNQISLGEHLRSHATGAKKPYTCSVCSKSFLQSNNLQTHMK